LQEAMGRLLENPSLRAAMGAAGRNAIRARYTPERVLTQLDQVYAELEVTRAKTDLQALRKAA
ncbi:MAG TPA: glycosyltransferase, partial [Burkholderiales bacterium]|nr:glycosyltransferase [Burkholderiales bacterium]